MTGSERSVVVIGVGNELRGDDAAGLAVVRRLRGEHGLITREHQGEGTKLLDLWDGADAVVLVDAVRSGAPPGTIHRVDASSEPVPASLQRTSSHTIGVAEAVELGRTLRRLPATVILFGVEGTEFAAGALTTAAVARAIDPAADAVRREARSVARQQLD